MRDINQAVYEIICSVKELTGVGVCLYDREFFFSARYGMLEKRFNGHYCDYCNAVKALPGGQIKCDENDRDRIHELALMYRAPFFNVCHAGVLEYIVPIFSGDELVATLFIGQCTIGDETAFAQAIDRLERLLEDAEHTDAASDGDLAEAARKAYIEQLHELYKQLPVTTKERLSSAGRLAQVSLERLAELPRLMKPDTNSVAELARRHIDYYYMNDVSLDRIAEIFHVNPSYLSRAFHKSFGLTISEHIQNTRIEQAKKLLAFTRIPITNISFNIGYSDPNYFIRVFKRVVGTTPHRYRMGQGK